MSDQQVARVSTYTKRTISQYIKIALQEGKYATKFNKEIYLRANALNSTHLYYMQEHLEQAAVGARSKVWVEANKNILDKVSREIQWRSAIIDSEIAAHDAEEERVRKQMEHEEARAIEEERVLKAIIASARERAVAEVHENEKKRMAAERARAIAEVKANESVKTLYLQRAAVFFVLTTVLVCAVTADPAALGSTLAAILSITGIVVYRAFSLTRIFPEPKPQAQLDEEAEANAQKMIEQALQTLQMEEQVYRERMRLEHKERQTLRKTRKEQELKDLEAMEQKKKARLEMVAALLDNEKKEPQEGKQDESINASVDILGMAKASTALLNESMMIATNLPFLKQERSQHALNKVDSRLEDSRRQQMSINKQRTEEALVIKKTQSTALHTIAEEYVIVNRRPSFSDVRGGGTPDVLTITDGGAPENVTLRIGDGIATYRSRDLIRDVENQR